MARKTEVPKKNQDLLQYCTTYIPHGLTWERIRAFLTNRLTQGTVLTHMRHLLFYVQLKVKLVAYIRIK